MSASIKCPACHRPISGPATRCTACGAQVETRERLPQGARLRSLEAWPGLNGLVVAQETAGSYWFLGRDDYRRLSELVESWSAPDDPVRRLLAAKLHRGLVCDPAELPRDVAKIGARVEFRIGSDVESCVIADPDAMHDLRDPVSVATPLGVLLLGMIEGRSLRGHGPDAAPFTLSIEAVHPPESSHIPSSAQSGAQAAVSARA